MKSEDDPEPKCSGMENTSDYNDGVDKIREEEYPMLNGTTYLDHAGTTLYPKSVIEDFSKQMTSNLFGNPHSASSSSQLSTTRINDVRLHVLQYFKADPDHFDLVFVANATAGIKMVMEAFREVEGGFWYGYHRDSHTSLVGVREAARAGHQCLVSDAEVEEWLEEEASDVGFRPDNSLGLFAYPAQSNMDGGRLPLDWPSRLRGSEHGKTTYSLLDAAALVSTAPLDLSDQYKAPDFTALSFTKIFGFPDLGGLIIRKESGSILRQRSFFGGGTVEIVTCGEENWHIHKQGSLHDQLEDGTLPVHSIVALDCALDAHVRLYESMERIASHTGFLAKCLHRELMTLRHYNDTKVCEVYKHSASIYGDSRTQGPIIALNLKNDRGDFISNTEVEKLASIRNIQLRSGGLCNPGGIASSLGLAPWELKRNFSAGQRCGGENDVIDGKPTGMLRISLGAMSNLRDCNTFVQFIREFFLERAAPGCQELERLDVPSFYLETVTIYPIKSCGGWAVPTTTPWDVREEGLAWDREWCIVHQGTRNALSQKKYPVMSLLKPQIDFVNGLLRVRYHGSMPPSIVNEISVPLSADPTVFQNYGKAMASSDLQVCGDNVAAQLYRSPIVATFFTTLLGTPCTLARFPAASSGLSTRHSKAHLNSTVESQTQRPLLLSNESPILAISRSSLNRLNEQIKQKDGKAAHASVFRANLILAERPPLPGYEQPYIEDNWQSLHIGENVKLDVLGGCRRCQMVCVDQTTAEKNAEPFVTLAKTRRKAGSVLFGVHSALSKGGGKGSTARIRIGDRVRPVVKSA